MYFISKTFLYIYELLFQVKYVQIWQNMESHMDFLFRSTVYVLKNNKSIICKNSLFEHLIGNYC